MAETDAEFGHGGLAADQFQEALIFVGLEAMLLDDVGGNLGGRGFCHVAGGLAARKGIHNGIWAISPVTPRPGLQKRGGRTCP